MKSLNRTLSLVLVLVMVFGLFGVASATSFTDAAKIQYTEAVGVMTGIGAINGYTDGTFAPTATITREEAAKMITYAILGPTVAARLSVTGTNFKDVEAGRWSAPFISYCVSKGILNGMGDGTFAPTANVTGYQLAKMMLCAAGYGKQGEYLGSSWELNVAVDANKYKIFAGSKAATFSAPATREETALYVFNGIYRVELVTYSKLTETYSNTDTNATLDADTTPNNTISDVLYTNLKAVISTFNGHAVRYFTNNSKVITDYQNLDTVLASSTNGTPYTNLISKGATGYINFKPDTTVAIYLNGKMQKTDTYVATGYSAADGLYAVADTTATTGDLAVLTALGEANDAVGTVIQFVDTDADSLYNAISITTYTLSQVTGATAEKADGTEATVTITGLSTLKESAFVSGFAGLAKNDYVMYATIREADDSAVAGYIAYEPTTFVGAMSKYNTSYHSMTIGDKTYYASAATNPLGLTQAQAFTGVASSTYFVDANGYVVAVNGVANTNYVVVDSIALVTGTGVSAVNQIQAKLVLPDGSSKVVTVASIDGFGTVVAPGTDLSAYDATAGATGTALTNTAVVGTTYTGYLTAGDSTTAVKFICLSATASANTAYAGQIYTYSLNSSSNYLLVKDTSTAVGAGVSMAKGIPTIMAGTPAAGNNGTVYVYKTIVNAVPVYTVYTGYKNAPSATGVSVDYAVTTASGVVFCYVDASGASAIGDTTNTNVVFFWNGAYSVDNTDPTAPLYEYNGILNGTKQTVVATSILSTIGTDTNTLYTATLNSKGQVTAIAACAGANFTLVKANGDVKALAGIMAIDSVTLANGVTTATMLTFAGTEPVYLVSKSAKTVSTGSFSDILDNADFYVKTVGTTTTGTSAEKIAVSAIYVLVD